jgi:hypothetical protein
LATAELVRKGLPAPGQPAAETPAPETAKPAAEATPPKPGGARRK